MTSSAQRWRLRDDSPEPLIQELEDTKRNYWEPRLRKKEVVVHTLCYKTSGCGYAEFVYAPKETGKVWQKSSLMTTKCKDPFSYLGNSQPTSCWMLGSVSRKYCYTFVLSLCSWASTVGGRMLTHTSCSPAGPRGRLKSPGEVMCVQLGAPEPGNENL